MPGVTIGGTFPKIAAVANKMAFVRSFAHNNSGHVGGTHFVNTGYDNRNIDNGGAPARPSIGSIVARVPRQQSSAHRHADLRAAEPHSRRHRWPGVSGHALCPFDPNGQALKNLSLAVSENRLDDRRVLLASLDRMNSDVDRFGAMEGLGPLRAAGIQPGARRRAGGLRPEARKSPRPWPATARASASSCCGPGGCAKPAAASSRSATAAGTCTAASRPT